MIGKNSLSPSDMVRLSPVREEYYYVVRVRIREGS